jgi:hypothetical protein
MEGVENDRMMVKLTNAGDGWELSVKAGESHH